MIRKKQPFIGLTTRCDPDGSAFSLRRAYGHALSRGGAVPVMIPPLLLPEQIAMLAETLDGLVLSGGLDVDPALYGEPPHPKLGIVDPERDRFELALCREWLKTGKPLLAICRGMQLLNAAAGGSLWQDIPSECPAALPHAPEGPRGAPAHPVVIRPGSLLGRWAGLPDGAGENGGSGVGVPPGGNELPVNSIHHQAVARIGAGFHASAWSADGLVEAIEAADGKPFLGVQWHPEEMVDRFPAQLLLFQSFAETANAPAWA